MNSGPSPISASGAGTPISYQTTETNRNSAPQENRVHNKNEAIADTLETSDGEADGKQALDQQSDTGQPPDPHGNIIDLSG